MAHKWARWLHNPCRLGVPTASERGAESEVAHKWARWLHNPCRLGVPTASERGAESEVAHKWARWLHNPCRLGGPHRLRAGGRIRSGSNQKWKILIFWGHATKRGFQSGGTTSELAHKWAQWKSEVGKLIFWVSNLLSKKKFSTKIIYLVKKIFLLSKLLSKKKFLISNLLSRKPTPRGKTW